jgi:hypothetical protein
MTQKQILTGIEVCYRNGDLDGLNENLDLLLEAVSDEDASQALSLLIYNRYKANRGDSLAKLLEIIIRKRPNLALLKHPDNYLYRVALLRGSIDLYECYLEEAVQPFISKLEVLQQKSYYMDLQNVAAGVTGSLFLQFQKCIKGRDYNSAFATSEDNEGVVLINREDYEIMDDIVEKYNAILGGRDIVKDLYKRMGMES